MLISSSDSGSVWTRMESLLDATTTGFWAASMPVPVTAFVTSSTLSDGFEIWAWNSTPPRNSMPKFSPRKNSPPRATSTMASEMRYQVLRRLTKSMETSPR